MYKKKRNTILATLEQLLPVILAVVCVLVMTVNTLQSSLAIPLPLNFEGEYSFDGGETWQALTASSDLSANQGDLLLRGGILTRRSSPGVSCTCTGIISALQSQSTVRTVAHLSTQKIDAIFVDADTYPDLVRLLNRQNSKTPVILLCRQDLKPSQEAARIPGVITHPVTKQKIQAALRHGPGYDPGPDASADAEHSRRSLWE